MVADRHCRPCHDQGGSTLLIESGLVRVPHRIARIAAIIATSVMALAMIAGHAYAQVVEITPPPSQLPRPPRPGPGPPPLWPSVLRLLQRRLPHPQTREPSGRPPLRPASQPSRLTWWVKPRPRPPRSDRPSRPLRRWGLLQPRPKRRRKRPLRRHSPRLRH